MSAMTNVHRTWSLVLLVSIAIWQITDTAAKYHHIKFRHGKHRRRHTEGYLPSSFVTDTNDPEEGLWGAWSTPSSCSRSCGGGVAYQTRHCLDLDSNGYDRCTGAKKRFFSCNIQPCPNPVDFRAEQCAEFNSKPFEGVFYEWIPYTGAPNKCELNCMPRGERFFYRHKRSVIDGTPCDVEKNDVCVEGKCMTVGCDMMLGSDAREDACRECGGDGSDCNTVNGSFETNDLQVGYIDILLIPEGATNIVIKEVAPSNNYLAIRNTTGHYYLNGNWRIDFPRSIKFANTIFHYSRDPQGFSAPDMITALGPTNEAIYVVLLYQDRNVGVQYEYSIPKKFAPQADPDSYTWTADEFSECSVSCGGGYQSRQVMCIRRRDNEQVDDHLCDLQLEPDDTQSCNEEACPPQWVESEWTPCNKLCGEGGERTREIKCEQIIAGGIPTVVDDSVCIEKVGVKNETTQKCNENVECPMWHIGPWKPCDHLCGKGKQTRKVTCYRKNESGKIEVLPNSSCEDEVPESEKPCELRPCAGLDWVVSEWSGCNDKCGLVQETRTAHCTTQDGTIYPDDKCDPDKKPELTRECESVKDCEYQWYTTQWSECSAKCGKGVQTRIVFCATFEDETTLKKVSNDNCDAAKRYNDTKECTADIVECKGEWFAGPWSKCSKPCGGGDMTRKVICMKNNMSVSVSECDEDSIMFSTEECNKHPCSEDEVLPVEPMMSTIPPDEDDECEEYEDEDYVTLTSILTSDEDEQTGSTESSSNIMLSMDTDSTVSDGIMMSDAAFTRGDIAPTDTGSGFGSGDSSEDDALSTLYTSIPVSSSDLSTFEGSGAFTDDKLTTIDISSIETVSVSSETSSGITDTTEKSTMVESSSYSGISDVTSPVTSDETSSVTKQSSSDETPTIFSTMFSSSTLSSLFSSSSSSDSSSEMESSSESSSSSSLSTDNMTTDGSTVSSASEITDATVSTSELSSDVISTSDITQSTTESSTVSSSDTTQSTSESSTVSSSDTTQSTSESSTVSSSDVTSTDVTESTSESSTISTSDLTEPTSESSTVSSSDVTESIFESSTVSSSTSDTLSTDVTQSTSESSSDETSSINITTETSGSTSEFSSTSTEMSVTSEILTTSDASTVLITTKLPFSILPIDGESEIERPHEGTEKSLTTDITSESTSSDMSTTEVSGSTESSIITTSSEDSTTVSGSTETSSSTSLISEETTLTEITESSPSSTMESEKVTESSETTESMETSTITESSTMTNESEGTSVSEETSSQSSISTESTVSTEFLTDTSSTSEETSVSGVTDMTDEEDTDLTSKSSVLDLFTTANPLNTAIDKEHKLRKCKIKKKRKTCKTSPFGCCYDGVSEAQGPFGKGCPTPETCAETKFGCCPDGVSVATGLNNNDCPSSHCNDTLFGCCQDGTTPAEGNDFEGCKKPCNETEFGCCPDQETPASGKNNYGCCNTTEHGCCPDGIEAASGPNQEGCKKKSEEGVKTDCSNSTYGCCPDGQKPASGINFEGCGVINNENCSASYFGCCSDNATAALGPNEEGCHAPCELSTYGCCQDRVTPAHGPNGEGCCLSSPFKCCPDNILPARGPDLYGCGCQYTRFRCCPDNTTAARGPNNEGCGCEYTAHGCCPNKFTPSNGPNYEGCPCYTYQFGCCSDGITIAKGPRGYGCDCETTEFKCCSDGRTPAKGPNFAGCACDASKYGCCPDGIEEAQGEHFEGCRTVPTPPGSACSLAKDRGSCRDFSVKWFFDTEYGGCSRFWYGGCEGNNNRFNTQEECREVCVEPKGRDACYLPKSTGPCEGYNPMWYYDSEREQCGQFIYGGCLGNDNKFETREKCEKLCVIPDDIDPCELEKETGPCIGNYTRWYFNKESQTCEQFQYGGCKPNTNNFPTEAACHQQCLQPGRRRVINEVCILEKDPGPCSGSLLRWYFHEKLGACRQFVYGGCKGNGNKFRTRVACERRCLVPDYCLLPRAEGNCTEKYPKWYFDPSENRCMPFYYTGCNGNRNNFDTREACELDCPPKIEQDVCLLPAVLGKCHNYTQRWYFDSFEKSCRQFYYGGCEGNENNFLSKQECSNRCETSGTPPPTQPQRFSPAMCFLPYEHGPCTNDQTKWFYDSRDGICKQFNYGGCATNGNKFESLEECEYRCGNIQDVCSMPKVIGPCSGSLMQFYYNRDTDTCEEFEYSECGGNKNRFQDHETCESKCKRRPVVRPEPPTSAPVVPASEIVPSSPICTATVDAGSCNLDITAYYYDSRTGVCQAFLYGGCEGNANRFQSEEQCERLCGRFQGQEMCNLPMDSGPCRGSFSKYYYDSNARTCRPFYFGGCDGNANRFSSVAECESVCLHREEPSPLGNNTGLSQLAICREPVDVGSCLAGNFKRFYFDEERQTCMGFVYTGCGGNRNKFKTFESCMNTCFRSANNELGTDKNETKDPCSDRTDQCNVIQCPYGKEAFVDEQNCEHCRCVNPCKSIQCSEGSQCSITLVASPNGGTEYRAVCRTTTKPGQCPHVSNSTRCERECSSDADCPQDWKCCDNGCGTSCLAPALEQPPPEPVHNITAPPYGSEPAAIQQPEQPHVSGEEGGYIQMKCIATGNPKPVLTWKKDATIINISESRKRILNDGTLEIVNLYSYDRGIYICIADNGLAPPVKTEYQLEVTEPHDHSAAIVGETNTSVTVAMNSPTVLHCYAMGWPRPSVTWWHGERLLPLSSESYEQDSEYTLLIRSVTITNLGIYTCQAYNGIERPASWSVTLQALGPIYNVKPEHAEYTKYLVQPPKRPTVDRPQYPYRPSKPNELDTYHQTYAPIYSDNKPYIPPVISLTESPPQPTVLKVPVTVNVSTPNNEVQRESQFSISCKVDGYPVPQVLWYKDNDIIRTDGRVSISESNTLVVDNAGSNDTGVYRCEAYNEYSSSSDDLKISVKGSYISADCIDTKFFARCDLIVMGKYCQHPYYAKFCCRSCTEAGQLPVGNHSVNSVVRKRRSIGYF